MRRWEYNISNLCNGLYAVYADSVEEYSVHSVHVADFRCRQDAEMFVLAKEADERTGAIREDSYEC
jgi:hypothetical protein